MATIGHTKGVASKLGISNRTVEHHLSNARQKLGCESTIQAIDHLRRPSEARSLSEPILDAVKSDTDVEKRPHPRLRGLLLWAAALLVVGTIGSLIALRSSSLAHGGNTSTIDAPSKIIEDFEYSSIDPRWTIRPGNNRVFTVNGDYLRYELTKATVKDPMENNARAYAFFSGRDWRLSFKVKYSLPGTHNGRQQWLRIGFDGNADDPEEFLNIEATKDLPLRGQPPLSAAFKVSYAVSSKSWQIPSKGEIPDVHEGVDCWFEIVRHGSSISIRWSGTGADGHFSDWFSAPLDPNTGNLQSITIWGSAYDDPNIPRGVEGWADYDYIHLEPLPQQTQ